MSDLETDRVIAIVRKTLPSDNSATLESIS